MARRRDPLLTWGYIAVLAGAFALSVAAGWTTLASRMDRDAYDWMTRAHPAPERTPGSVVVAFDERSLAATGGMRELRTTLAAVLEKLAQVRPAVVSVDLILAEAGDPEQDRRLAAAMRRVPKLILGSDLIPDEGVWEDPLPVFGEAAEAVGHVHAAPDPVSRVLPLELAGQRDRRWAMALEAARLASGAAITEAPDGLELGGRTIPARRETARALYVRYREGIPVVPVLKVLRDEASLAELAGKVVFIGVTAQTAARDRLMTPLDRSMSGVEIHAQAYETIAGGDFLWPAPLSAVVLLCLALTVLPGLIFAFLPGWAAYGAAAAVLVAAHLAPHGAFRAGVVLPYLATVMSAWLATAVAAAWQYFVVRGRLRRAEMERQRYQQAIQFVTHEMRSPLTAIQGSSELMGRYSLPEEKRKQMAQMIHSESRRLAKMIQTFLDIERLSEDGTEIRSEPFELRPLLETCLERANVLAERKNIAMTLAATPEHVVLKGDRELMEYAVYNLLTNAVKYSPADTRVTVSATMDGEHVRLSVADEGMGMDEKELRNLFTRFYRTKRAEASGEVGTGIGLSLVRQIVTHHNGRMEVTSKPGEGSCFTMVLPASADTGVTAR